jgi:glycosyltransferase involved in cell wall biosynthesis
LLAVRGHVAPFSDDIAARTACPGRSELGADEARFDMVVADASWSWTERLFSPLVQRGANVLLLRACDWRTAREQRRPWRDWTFPRRRIGPHLWDQTLVLPPGWMKTYPRFGMRPLAWAIQAWRRSLAPRRPLVLAISYPHYLYLSDTVRPDALVYYNMDDYALYWPDHARTVRALERRVVETADLSVVCARVRAEQLTSEVPCAGARIVHLPHGAPAESLAPVPLDRPADPPTDLARLPRPYLGFIGSLEDRLDWPLLERVARVYPAGSVVLIGRSPQRCRAGWYRDFERLAALPNVHLLGWKTQQELGRYMAAFDVCLIPYRVDHPFNHAACPTKIMDYMASTRPIVSTALPECRLYANLFSVAPDRASFVESVGRIVAAGSCDGRAKARWDHARASTWEATAGTLLHLLVDRASLSQPPAR